MLRVELETVLPCCALLCLALVACRAEDVVAVADGAAAIGGGASGSGDCPATGPALSLTSGAGQTTLCTGQLASNTFTHALCTCTDISVPRALFSSGSDSTGSDTRRGGAAIGVNGNYPRAGSINLDGSLKVASSQPIITAGDVSVGGDLWLGAPVTIAGLITVGRDAWLEQSVSAVGVALIGRDLHLAPDAMLSTLGVARVRGATTTAPLTLTPPCACDAAELLDIAGAVAAARSANDDVAFGVGPDLDAAPNALSLACGRFSFSASKAISAHVKVEGRVALFVEGDVEASSQFVLDLAPGAELDWFIDGNLILDPGARVGDPVRPAATRIYVRGDGEIQLPGSAETAFNLYAPAAPVSVVGGGDVFGSIFARQVSSSTDLLLHYDRAILHAKDACTAAPGSCQPCAQCSAGLACLNNACFSCQGDSDCCAPFACLSGKCEPLTAD